MKATFVLGSLLALLSTGALADCPQQAGYNGGADVLPACNDEQPAQQQAMREEVQQPGSGNSKEGGQRISLAASDTERRYDCYGNPQE